MIPVQCTNCRQPYPETGTPYRCPQCGGLYDATAMPAFDAAQVAPGRMGIWRYQAMLGLASDAPQVSLGEGNTPLVWSEAGGREVAFKCEYLNPTGSYKDRGSAALVSFLRSRGVAEAVEDSSGNAGASFAAYAARAGLTARVYIPDAAAGPKRAQIEAYGAQVVRIMGPRSNAAEAVKRVADAGMAYASHAYLPFNLPGYATMAYEIFEQLGQGPGTLVVPVGQGGLLLGLWRGFQALQVGGLIKSLPRLVGVQARACAPIWATYSYGLDGLRMVQEDPTAAEGIRVRNPLRGDAVLHAVERSQGTLVAVDEDDIAGGRDELARRGLYVEPTSAVVWAALRALPLQAPAPVVAVLTGHGLKAA